MDTGVGSSDLDRIALAQLLQFAASLPDLFKAVVLAMPPTKRAQLDAVIRRGASDASGKSAHQGGTGTSSGNPAIQLKMDFSSFSA